MSFIERYRAAHVRTGAPLCIGLDTDAAKLPAPVVEAENPTLAFNTAIIETTSDLCCAYKPNLAFYESGGERGMDALRGTLAAIPKNVLTIGDAKRGDIGNTAERYAAALFEEWKFDAVTVNPLMGMDTLAPFFGYGDRCVFVLALTSNPGSADFQRLMVDGVPLYRHILRRCLDTYGGTGSLGFVVGATHPEELAEIREMIGPEIPLLIPGVGAQGGDAAATIRANAGGVALVNVSRGITAAGRDADFAERARAAAMDFVRQLAEPDPIVADVSGDI